MKTAMKAVLVCQLVVIATVTIAAAAAQAAEGGPVWLFGGEGRELAEKVKIKSSGTNFAITLAVGQSIECSTVSDSGELIPGNPGTDKAEITLTGCKLMNRPECEIRSVVGGVKTAVGTIGPLKDNSKLGYIPGSAKAEAGDLLTPEAGPFVIVEIEKANCMFKGKYEITGSVAAKLMIAAKPAKSGEEAELVEMSFPTTPIAELEVWNKTTKVFEKPTVELKYMSIKITFAGTDAVETEPLKFFGWKE